MIHGAKHIHMIGIGGIGMSGLAKLLIARGKTISGSDLVGGDITDDLQSRGVYITVGHMDVLPKQTDLVVYSAAVPKSNPERLYAHQNGIEQLSYAQALGAFSKSYSTIVVTGTHGKSTTTAMLGLILESAGYDPTVLVGSMVPTFADGNVRLGGSRFFVVEGCEYQANMMHLEPEMIVLTNVEMDHPDFYRDIDHVRETFGAFLDKCSSRGIVLINLDDVESKKLLTDRHVTFGQSKQAQYQPHQLSLKVPGRFNQMNALSATAAAMELGVPHETCVRALEDFSGIWRRFEHVGTVGGVDIISDYAHHPTAIEATVEAASEYYSGRRIILCYQPHQHARTQKLFKEFVKIFSKMTTPTILCEIYDVAGRNEDVAVSSRDIVRASKNNQIRYAKDLEDAQDQIKQVIQSGDVLVVMGAGDVDLLARRLIDSSDATQL